MRIKPATIKIFRSLLFQLSHPLDAYYKVKNIVYDTERSFIRFEYPNRWLSHDFRRAASYKLIRCTSLRGALNMFFDTNKNLEDIV